jgi:hypothetical protein
MRQQNSNNKMRQVFFLFMTATMSQVTSVAQFNALSTVLTAAGDSVRRFFDRMDRLCFHMPIAERQPIECLHIVSKLFNVCLFAMLFIVRFKWQYQSVVRFVVNFA